MIGAKHVPEATVLAIEVGFHAEHRDPAENERVLKELWLREALAQGPRQGGGRRRVHRRSPRLAARVGDVARPGPGDPDLPMDLAARLTDYITALEPLRPR